MTTNHLASKGHPPVTWFLDIDGVINSDGEPHRNTQVNLDTYRTTQVSALDSDDRMKTYPIIYSTVVIDFINEVSRSGVNVVWLTTWEDQAVSRLAPAIGVDDFPVARRPPGVLINDPPPRRMGWWKEMIVRKAYLDGVRQIIWTDDLMGKALRQRTSALFDRALLITIDANPGLDVPAMERITAFLGGNSANR